MSTKSLESIRLAKWDSSTIQPARREAKNGQNMTENDTNMENAYSMDMLRDSMDKMYQQLQEIKESNASQFKKGVEQYKHIKKYCQETEKLGKANYKEMKEAMQIQHRETRRMLERTEKKTI